jgi:hypothetical protein
VLGCNAIGAAACSCRFAAAFQFDQHVLHSGSPKQSVKHLFD